MNDGQKEGNRRKGMIQRSALQPLRASQCKGEISLFVSIAAAVDAAVVDCNIFFYAQVRVMCNITSSYTKILLINN